MQAYQQSDLYSKYIDEQAGIALQASCIKDTSYAKILKAYPCKLFTPNYFIRIALGLLTIVAMLFSGLLLWLIFSASGDPAIITLLVLLAVLCYGTLELLVKQKRFYNAGVDNVLMSLVILFVGGIFFVSDSGISWLGLSSVTMFIGLWLCIRFTDAFMAMVSYCCFFIFLFLFYLKLGEIGKSTAPLVMMAVSALVYVVMKQKIRDKIYIYQYCFKAVAFLSLITFYASGNYFVVKEISEAMFHQQMSLIHPVLFGWLFWVLTCIIPPVYIIYGILKKDFLLMRTGLLLIAATIFTVKYYYSFLPVEIEMLLAGIILIALSYAFIKYLVTPKYGFTSIDLYSSQKEALNAEALLITETFNRQSTIENNGLFGGGSGGGGGATGQF